MKILIFVLLMIVAYENASAGDVSCSKAEAFEAEVSASRLDSWDEIYASFRKFQHCDDGAIAEGYSDSIAKMFAYHWEQLDEFVRLASIDDMFSAFVLRHIDATADCRDLDEIIHNSSARCPESMHDTCLAIEDVAKKAVLDLHGYEDKQ